MIQLIALSPCIDHKLTLKLFCDRRSVGQSVLVSDTHPKPMNRFLLLWYIHVLGRPNWREDRSVIYSYSCLSLSVTSPTELMTTLTVSFEATGIPVCRFLRLTRLQWRHYNPPPPNWRNLVVPFPSRWRGSPSTQRYYGRFLLFIIHFTAHADRSGQAV
jgi:hypothetical protein